MHTHTDTHTYTHAHTREQNNLNHMPSAMFAIALHKSFPILQCESQTCLFSWTNVSFPFWPQCFSHCLDSSILIIRLSRFLLRKVHVHLPQSLKINQRLNPDKKLQAGAGDDAMSLKTISSFPWRVQNKTENALVGYSPLPNLRMAVKTGIQW